MPPRATNIPITQIRVYRSPAGSHWAILRSAPNSYFFTRHGYVEPRNAVNKLIYGLNSNNVGQANRATIQHWMNGTRLNMYHVMDLIGVNALAHMRAANTLYNIGTGRRRLATLARALGPL